MANKESQIESAAAAAQVTRSTSISGNRCSEEETAPLSWKERGQYFFAGGFCVWALLTVCTWLVETFGINNSSFILGPILGLYWSFGDKIKHGVSSLLRFGRSSESIE